MSGPSIRTNMFPETPSRWNFWSRNSVTPEFLEHKLLSRRNFWSRNSVTPKFLEQKLCHAGIFGAETPSRRNFWSRNSVTPEFLEQKLCHAGISGAETPARSIHAGISGYRYIQTEYYSGGDGVVIGVSGALGTESSVPAPE